MANYTTDNLLPTIPQNGIPAIRIGDQVFVMQTGGGGSTDFYKCATVSVPGTYYVVSEAGTAAVNGTFRDAGTTWKNSPVYSNTASSTTYYMVHDAEYDAWFILDYIPGESDNPLPSCLYYKESQWYIQEGGDPVPTVTEYSGSKTWTGYKAVFDAVTGTYSFEATATSGLTYGSGITPQIGGVYSDGATIAATLYQGDSLNIPGLVFYAPLSSAAAYAVTGQAISGSADAYATVQGIPCARFSSLAAYLSASDSALPHGNSPVALSSWLNYSVVPSDFSGILSYGNNQSFGQTIAFTDWNSVLFSGTSGANALTDVTPSTGTWYHFLSIYDGNGTITNYINGIVSGQPLSSNLNINTGNIQIAPTEVSRDIYVASVRIYNRVPTPSEIAALANEFTPTA